MTPRRATRNGAAHRHVAAACLAGALVMLACSLGASYAGPTLGTWVFGALAFAFAVLFVVALLPDRGPDDANDFDDEVPADVREDERQHPEDYPHGLPGYPGGAP